MNGFTIFESNVKCWQTKEKRTKKIFWDGNHEMV